MNRRICAKTLEVCIKICLQFVHQDRQFSIVKFSYRWNICRINQRRPKLFENFQSIIDNRIDTRMESKVFSHDTNSRSLQTF